VLRRSTEPCMAGKQPHQRKKGVNKPGACKKRACCSRVELQEAVKWCGGRRRGVALDRRLLVLCCEDEGELDVGASLLSESTAWAPALSRGPDLTSPIGSATGGPCADMSHSRRSRGIWQFVGTARCGFMSDYRPASTYSPS
jgi:hypothetical protein